MTNKHIKENRPSFRPLPLLPITEERILEEKILSKTRDLEERIRLLELENKLLKEQLNKKS